MSKKALLASVAAAALSLGMATARAADIEPVAESASWYVSFFGGATWLDDVDTRYDFGADRERNEAGTERGMIIGGAIGTWLTDDLRVEFEVAYSDNRVDSVHYESENNQVDGVYDATGYSRTLTFMGNIWYDVPVSDWVTPYIGGGAGIAFIDGETRYLDNGEKPYDSSETGLAFQAGAGLRFAVLDNVTLDVGYRLRGVEGVKFGDSDFAASSDYDADTIISHNIIGGVSIGFPGKARAEAVAADRPAEDHVYYVSLFGGASLLEDLETVQHYDTRADYDYSLDLRSGYIVGGALGTRIADPLRAEVELSYARWKADRVAFQGDNPYNDDAAGHVSATYLLGNLWYDINTDTSFTPYVGGGAGAAWVDADTRFGDDPDFGYSDGEMAFAFQLGGGLIFGLTQNISVDVGYRFKGALDVDLDAQGEDNGIVPYDGGDLYSHNLQGGVIVSF